MTSAEFLFCLTCFFIGEVGQTTALKFSVFQDSGFISVEIGANLTLRCFSESNVGAKLYWYKQTLGQKLSLISTFYKFDRNGTFHNEFNNNPRFSLDSDSGKNHLAIADLHVSDSATYYCASSYSYKFEFAEGITVSVQGSGSNVPALVHQSVSGSLHPGGSVTLNCTVHTGICDGQHSVYWFKDSGQTPPGIIYTQGDRNDQCERKPDTQDHNTSSCIYNLPVNNLSLSHAGTYYCAVASCGHILFGKGTKLDFDDASHGLAYLLSGALAFTIILSVLLTFVLCNINKRNICQCTETHSNVSASCTRNTESQQNAETIHYAAIRQQTTRRSKRQGNKFETECVYTGIKQ